MNIDISKIVKRYGLNSTEESILIYIINNIDKVKSIGVRGIAKEHFTSTTTIMNLAKKIEYDGFLDMYYNLNFILKNQDNIFMQNMEHKKVENSDNKTFEYINQSQIDMFIELLKENKESVIYTSGKGFSTPIVDYITRKLIVNGYNCINSDSYESYENNTLKAKLLFVVSKSGETEFLINICNSAQKNGIKVIAFTGHIENRLADIADIGFKIYDQHPMDDRNKCSNEFFPKVIMMFEYLWGEYVKNNLL